MSHNPDNIHLPEMPLPPGLPPDDDFPCCRQHPAEALLTASEVKVLTETALRLGRKEAGDEIAETLEALGDSIGEGNQRELLADLADIARDIGSSPLGATWDVRSGVPGHQEVSEAIGSPQEPCGHPTCPCASQEAR